MLSISTNPPVKLAYPVVRLTVLCVALALGQAHAAAGVIFDGSMLPEDQGWTVGGSNLTLPYPFFTNGSVYDMNTIGAPHSGASAPMHLWQKNVGTTTGTAFSVAFSLKVIDDTVGHNLYDAPIAFLGDYHGGFGLPQDRETMIYFDEDEVGWADESDAYAINTTDDFHTYRLDVDQTGLAQFYVDGNLALTRTGFTADGVIAFGDQTNDLYGGPDVDGHFQLAWMTLVTRPRMIFDGAFLPEDQGWTVGGSNLILPYPFSTIGNAYDMNTIGAPHSGPSAPMHLWEKNVGTVTNTGFSIELSLKVLDDTVGHNQYDAPIAFLADYHGGFGSPQDREKMVYFDEDEVGWGDETDTYAVNTTDRFHTYRLSVDDTGLAQFYVDGTLALTRTGFTTDGMVAFGDQTNDLYGGPDVDGHFRLAWMTVVPPWLLGDLNCDDVLDAFDIDPFVLALTNPTGYAQQHPDCDIMNADCNADGIIDAFDIDPFVELLVGP